MFTGHTQSYYSSISHGVKVCMHNTVLQTEPHLALPMLVTSLARGAGRGRGYSPLGAGHSDCHMGGVIGKDVNGDLGGWGQAGGEWGADWVGSIRWWCRGTEEHEQQMCYLLKTPLPAPGICHILSKMKSQMFMQEHTFWYTLHIHHLHTYGTWAPLFAHGTTQNVCVCICGSGMVQGSHSPHPAMLCGLLHKSIE